MNSFYNQVVHIVENPPIPFSHSFQSFPVESEVVITGSIYNGSQKRFSVEFHTPNHEIALVVQPRFKLFDNHIILNWMSADGKWQSEEKHSNFLSVGDAFTIRIINQINHFMIAINNHQPWLFRHRLPSSTINFFQINGDAYVHKVQFINFKESPPSPPSQLPTTYPTPQAPPPYNPYVMPNTQLPSFPNYPNQLYPAPNTFQGPQPTVGNNFCPQCSTGRCPYH